MPQQSGNAIFILFIALALFAALSYAFLQGSRSSVALVQDERDKAISIKTQDCTNTINMAVKRLTLRGCGSTISYQPSGANLNVGAPQDGSCSVYHVNGGGVSPCTLTPTCDLTALAVGQSCDGIIYAGVSSGRRIYTTASSVGSFTWASNTPNVYRVTGVGSATDGLANTNILVALTGHAAPFPAAQACRALGPEWYLPARQELVDLWANRNVGQLAGTIPTSGFYWASIEFTNGDAFVLNLANGTYPTPFKGGAYPVRCMRRD